MRVLQLTGNLFAANPKVLKAMPERLDLLLHAIYLGFDRRNFALQPCMQSATRQLLVAITAGLKVGRGHHCNKIVDLIDRRMCLSRHATFQLFRHIEATKTVNALIAVLVSPGTTHMHPPSAVIA